MSKRHVKVAIRRRRRPDHTGHLLVVLAIAILLVAAIGMGVVAGRAEPVALVPRALRVMPATQTPTPALPTPRPAETLTVLDVIVAPAE